MAHHACQVERRMEVTHQNFNMKTQVFSNTRVEWETKACDNPLFTALERESGVCRSCAKGWEVEKNYPTEKGRAQIADARGVCVDRITTMHDKPPTLEEAQKIVGGWVERITLWDGSQMLVDEEGLIKKLPLNRVATRIARMNIVGPALILRGKARWLDNDDEDEGGAA